MIHWLIEGLILAVLVDAVLSFVPDERVRRHPAVVRFRQAMDVLLRPIREILPKGLPFDFSPLVLIFLLRALEALL